MKNRIVLFPGSFNPFHVGHLNVLEKAEAIFGKGNVVICIGINPEKLFSPNFDEYNKKLDEIQARVQELKENTGRPVQFYKGFLHDFITDYEKRDYDVIVVRGLRNGDDLNYEMNQLAFIQDFKKDVKTIFIACDKELAHISSSAVRMIKQFGGDESTKQYII
jgi:pantetheine-phosphate adenylyltransferase